MADLIIGGNTYKNTDYVRFKKTDGKIATFYDSARKDNQRVSVGTRIEMGPDITPQIKLKSEKIKIKVTSEVI